MTDTLAKMTPRLASRSLPGGSPAIPFWPNPQALVESERVLVARYSWLYHQTLSRPVSRSQYQVVEVYEWRSSDPSCSHFDLSLSVMEARHCVWQSSMEKAALPIKKCLYLSALMTYGKRDMDEQALLPRGMRPGLHLHIFIYNRVFSVDVRLGQLGIRRHGSIIDEAG